MIENSSIKDENSIISSIHRKYGTSFSSKSRGDEFIVECENTIFHYLSKVKNKEITQLNKSIKKIGSKLKLWPESERLKCELYHKQMVLATFDKYFQLAREITEICEVFSESKDGYLTKSEKAEINKELLALKDCILYHILEAEKMKELVEESSHYLASVGKDFNDSGLRYFSRLLKSRLRRNL